MEQCSLTGRDFTTPKKKSMKLYEQLPAHILEKNKQLLSNFQPDFVEKNKQPQPQLKSQLLIKKT